MENISNGNWHSRILYLHLLLHFNGMHNNVLQNVYVWEGFKFGLIPPEQHLKRSFNLQFIFKSDFSPLSENAVIIKIRFTIQLPFNIYLSLPVSFVLYISISPSFRLREKLFSS